MLLDIKFLYFIVLCMYFYFKSVNPNYDIPSLSLYTSKRTVLIEIKALSHLLSTKIS